MDRDNTQSKLVVQLPDHIWIGKLSRKFPTVNFEFKSVLLIEPSSMQSNHLFVIKGVQVQECLSFLKTLSDVECTELMEEKSNELTVMVRSSNHLILYIMQKYHIVAQFPIQIRNGCAEINLVGRRAEIDRFIEELHSKNMDVQLKQIGSFRSPKNKSDLTPRQLEIYQKAKKQGYYDSPRKITLTQLAEQEHISKSTLSVLLRRVHKKLLDA